MAYFHMHDFFMSLALCKKLSATKVRPYVSSTTSIAVLSAMAFCAQR
jgi:hypothetical protein